MILQQGPSKIMTTEKLRIERDGPVVFVDSKPVKREFVAFDATGAFYPLSGKDLLLVPEGDRTKEQWWFVTPNSKRDVEQLRLNDRVVRAGVKYQIQSVQNWGGFCQCRLMRIDVGPERT